MPAWWPSARGDGASAPEAKTTPFLKKIRSFSPFLFPLLISNLKNSTKINPYPRSTQTHNKNKTKKSKSKEKKNLSTLVWPSSFRPRLDSVL